MPPRPHTPQKNLLALTHPPPGHGAGEGNIPGQPPAHNIMLANRPPKYRTNDGNK